MENKAIYAGSFDPVTFGHLDLIERAATIFSDLTVAVVANLEKEPLFTIDQRMDFLRRSIESLPDVKVESFSGLLIKYAESKGARVLIRGLRAVADFEYEFQMTLTNRKLSPELKTVFLMPSESCSYISSRMIKEIAFLGGDVSQFVPPVVVEAFAEISKKR